jgi:hypothetical protein
MANIINELVSAHDATFTAHERVAQWQYFVRKLAAAHDKAFDRLETEALHRSAHKASNKAILQFNLRLAANQRKTEIQALAEQEACNNACLSTWKPSKQA